MSMTYLRDAVGMCRLRDVLEVTAISLIEESQIPVYRPQYERIAELIQTAFAKGCCLSVPLLQGADYVVDKNGSVPAH